MKGEVDNLNNNGSINKQKIVSGMRPTGKLHLGHYIGVLDNWVKLQNEYECYFFVADWHALTTKYDDTTDLRQNSIDVVMDWLACGIDPNVSTIYVQSLIPQIAELNIYLGMITPQNWVERDPTLKDLAKILRTKEGRNETIHNAASPLAGESANIQISYGLMGYPVLMSADIMMFNANVVPVGIDQVAHVEITRDIARRFNHIYKTSFFNEPIPKLTNTPLLCGLDGNKMGKSFNNDIKISDDEQATAKKIMRAVTDPGRIHKDDPGHPEKCEVVFKYWQIFGDSETIETVRCECEKGQRGCADCKRQLGQVINEKFAPIREKRHYLESHPDEVETIIKDGTNRALSKATEVLREVKKIIKMY